jgi:hypothetical protein
MRYFFLITHGGFIESKKGLSRMKALKFLVPTHGIYLKFGMTY